MTASNDQNVALFTELDARPMPGRIVGYLRYMGPGYLQSAMTLGGGSAFAALFSGAAFGYQLLWVAPAAMLLGVIVMSAIAWQTLSTGADPYDALKKHVHHYNSRNRAVSQKEVQYKLNAAKRNLADSKKGPAAVRRAVDTKPVKPLIFRRDGIGPKGEPVGSFTCSHDEVDDIANRAWAPVHPGNNTTLNNMISDFARQCGPHIFTSPKFQVGYIEWEQLKPACVTATQCLRP